MDINEFVKHKQDLVNSIVARLELENAVDFSDGEIERCLNSCSGNITDLAKKLRDAGLLVEIEPTIECKTFIWNFPKRQSS